MSNNAKTNEVFAPKPNKGESWDVIIIGSGPSGLTAGIYTSRGAASTLIFGGEKWGGQLMLTTEVDNYPGNPGIQGPDLMAKMKEHSTLFGAEFLQKNVTSINFNRDQVVINSDAEKYTAKRVIIATGADTRWLGVPGETELIGRGVSSCAPCDAPFFKGKEVAVVGGGDSAMEEALVLTKYASKVTILHRKDTFRASQAMQKKVFDKQKSGQIEILWNTEILKFVGDQKLKSVVLKNSKDGSERDFEVDGVFVAIGHIPSTDLFKGKVDLDEKGYVKKVASEKYHMATSHENIFVAGDVHDIHYKQAVTAAGFGCMAAMDALKSLDKSGPVW